MIISIFDKDSALNSSVHQYTLKKLLPIFRHFPQSTSLKITLSPELEKEKHRAEALAHIPGKELYCRATNYGVYSTVNRLLEKLSKRLTKEKYKKRLSDRNKKLIHFLNS